MSYNGSIKSGMSVVEQFPPGHVETYKLDTDGRAFLEETVRYHKIGETPAYTTFDVPLGMNSFFVSFVLPDQNNFICIRWPDCKVSCMIKPLILLFLCRNMMFYNSMKKKKWLYINYLFRFVFEEKMWYSSL